VNASEARDLLEAMFRAAVAAADPARLIRDHLPPRPKGRTVVIGAGKASAAMARAFEDAWDGWLEGLVVTRYGHGVPCSRIRVVEAAHPVPDPAGEAAALEILRLVQGLNEDDLVVALISGGGSALLSAPAPGLTLADKQVVNRRLLTSGADIAEMNCVRKHLSAVKGGRLAAAAWPARLLTLTISDVPGDDPAIIASGPTVPDPTTFADARAILARYGIDGPPQVIAHLEAAADETPKPGDHRFVRNDVRLIATPRLSLHAAAEVANARGIAPLILSDSIEGEAREVARVMAGIARQIGRWGEPLPAPAVILSGGETTVTVRGNGRGGRNVEFLLGLAIALNGQPTVHAVAGDTDGVDGAEEIAGAFIAPDTLTRARLLGIDARKSLADNDGHGFFEQLGDQLITGPTRTNVNDFRAVLVLPDGPDPA
jgi:hydroxypyruvate reductase